MDDKPLVFSSATNITLIMMVTTLIFLSIYSLIVGQFDQFDTIFAVFTNIIVGVTGFFFGKSTMEAANKKSLETEKNIKDASLSVPGIADNTKTSSTTMTTVQSESPIKTKK